MRRTTLGVLMCLVAAALASCAQSPSLHLTLGSSAASVIRGDQWTVPVSVAREGGASGAVTLSISGVPAGVTASFSADTLAAGVSSSVLTVQVAAGASEGTSTLTVHAIGGSLVSNANLDLTVASLTVHGTVAGILGGGYAGATVSIQGASTTSGAGGAFTLTGVSVPYDLIVSANNAIHVFEGMRAADPVVLPVGVLEASAGYPQGTVSGSLTPAVPSGFSAVVCADGQGVAMYTVVGGGGPCEVVAGGSSTYSLGVFWTQGSSVPVTVHALVRQLDANGLSTAIGSYGTGSGTLTNGGTATVDVAMGAPPSTTTVATDVNLPSGFAFSHLDMGIVLSPTFTLPVFMNAAPTSTSLNVVLPQLAGGTISAFAVGSAGGQSESYGWAMGGTGGPVTLTLGTPPTMTAPSDGATGIGVGDTLSIASTGGAAATFLLYPFGGGASMSITTMDNSVTIPDLSGLGFPLLASTSYDWQVTLSPTATTMEDAGVAWAGDLYAAMFALENGGPPSGAASGTTMSTAVRQFNTP